MSNFAVQKQSINLSFHIQIMEQKPKKKKFFTLKKLYITLGIIASTVAIVAAAVLLSTAWAITIGVAIALGLTVAIFTSKKFSFSSKIAALLGVGVAASIVFASWFIFIRVTPKGFALDCVERMKEAKAKYDQNKGTTSASEAIQDIKQAMFEGDKYYLELKQDGDKESIQEFEAIFRPVYDELKEIVESEE